MNLIRFSTSLSARSISVSDEAYTEMLYRQFNREQEELVDAPSVISFSGGSLGKGNAKVSKAVVTLYEATDTVRGETFSWKIQKLMIVEKESHEGNSKSKAKFRRNGKAFRN